MSAFTGRLNKIALSGFLKETAFEPEAVEAMGCAYEDLLRDLGLVDQNHPFTEIVAKEVLKVTSRGTRNATEIRGQILAALGNRAGLKFSADRHAANVP